RELADDLPRRAREPVRAHQSDERLLGFCAQAPLRVRAREELKRLFALGGELDPALGEAQGLLRIPTALAAPCVKREPPRHFGVCALSVERFLPRLDERVGISALEPRVPERLPRGCGERVVTKSSPERLEDA